jgi:glycosyltransferase involved in cell wall biosynthesis
VINKGGQREIVEHGVSGFLWNTLEELKLYTLQIARDEKFRIRMADAARLRAQLFSTEKFVNGFARLLSDR